MLSLIRTVSYGGSKNYLIFSAARTLSTTSVVNGNSGGGEGWLSKLLHVRKIEPTKDSHSKLLSDTERVYELQIHIWRYNRGYVNANQVLTLCREDQELKALSKDLVKNIISRKNQKYLPFFFGGPVQLRMGFKNWARGINYRKSSAVAGFFSQIGQLYMVHHIWTYKDLCQGKKFEKLRGGNLVGMNVLHIQFLLFVR
ncbi:Protein NipSnap like protein [Argiope bruennichi]|uniref:Protein NipSnap like protein n=1 Tax=Argiope bruennichi TaxID=94029 RepID=A0A8T0EYB1_ARGBR|nr:Protein NipSnap like protein [Argiope bruennichi]